MDQSSKITNEINIKMEPQDDIEFQLIEGTSHESPNFDLKIEMDEPIIKLQCENVKNEISEDPLDINEGIPVTEHCPIALDICEPRIKTEPTEEAEHISFGTHFLHKGANEHIEEDPSSEPKEDIKIEETEECLLTSNEARKKAKSKVKNQSLKANKQIEKTGFPCDVCGKICAWKSQLITHLRSHTGEKPFSCHVCKKSFSIKNTLDRHVVIHSAVKPHECDVCERVFSQKSTLDKHKLIHSGLKPYSCNECSRSFRQSYDLVKHKLLHTGNKPYVCDICNKAFTRRIYLIEHRRLHTGEKPFTCDICNKAFTLKYQLIQHTKIHEK